MSDSSLSQSQPQSSNRYQYSYTVSDQSGTFTESVIGFVDAASEQEAKEKVSKIAEKHAQDYATVTTTTRTISPDSREYGVALANLAAYEGMKEYQRQQQAQAAAGVTKNVTIQLNLPPEKTPDQIQRETEQKLGVLKVSSSENLTQTEREYAVSAALQEARSQEQRKNIPYAISKTFYGLGSELATQSRDYAAAAGKEYQRGNLIGGIAGSIASAATAVGSGAVSAPASAIDLMGTFTSPKTYFTTIELPSGKQVDVTLKTDKIQTAEKYQKEKLSERMSFDPLSEPGQFILQTGGTAVGFWSMQKAASAAGNIVSQVIPERQAAIVTKTESIQGKYITASGEERPLIVSRSEGLISKGARTEEFTTKSIQIQTQQEPLERAFGMQQTYTSKGVIPKGELDYTSYSKDFSAFRSVTIPTEKSTVSTSVNLANEGVAREVISRNLPRYTDARPQLTVSEFPKIDVKYDPSMFAKVSTVSDKMVITESISKSGSMATGKYLVGDTSIIGQVTVKEPGLAGKKTVVDVFIPKESMPLHTQPSPSSIPSTSDIAVKIENVLGQVTSQISKQAVKTAVQPSVTPLTDIKTTAATAIGATSITKASQNLQQRTEQIVKTQPQQDIVVTQVQPNMPNIKINPVTLYTPTKEEDGQKQTQPSPLPPSGEQQFITTTVTVKKPNPPIPDIKTVVIQEQQPIVDVKVGLVDFKPPKPPLIQVQGIDIPTVNIKPPIILPTLPGLGGSRGGFGMVKSRTHKEKWGDLLSIEKKQFKRR